jgi:peptide/nickel transport system substrate-binding protein
MSTRPQSTDRSRRAFLRTAALLGGGAALTMLGACQSAPPAPAATTAPAAKTGAAPSPAAGAAASPAAAGKPAASAGGAPSGGATGGGTLRSAIDRDFGTLDPGASTFTVETSVQWGVYGGLVRYASPKLDLEPDLAESWETPDPMTWVFHLRKGVQFHTGRAFTADDVLWNVDRYREIGAKGRVAGFLADVDKVEKVDDGTVRYRMKQPSGVFLNDQANVVFIDRESEKEIKSKPVGTGPLKFKEWIPNDHLTLERNPSYWDTGLQRAAEYRLSPIGEPQTRVANLRASEMEVAQDIPAQMVPEVSAEPGVSIVSADFSATYQALQFNVTRAPFDKVQVRQAVAYAIDRDAILRNVYFGAGKATGNILPQGHWAYDAAIDALVPQRDLAKSKALLSEAGYANGVEIEIKYHQALARVTEVIQQQLQEGGFQVKLNLMDASVYLDQAIRGHDFQMIPPSFTREVDPHGMMYTVFATGQGNNFGGYSNPKVDELFSKGKAEQDQNARKAIYNEIQKIVLQECPTIKLVTTLPAWGMSKKVQGAHLTPTGIPIYARLSLAS